MRLDPYGLRLDRDPALVPAFVAAIPPAAPAQDTSPQATGPSLALFDADGTLWTDDVADDFTTWMMAQGHISDQLWPTYLRIYRDDAPAGCRYLLRLYAGLEADKLAALVERWWLHHAHRSWVWPVIESLHLLAQRGHRVWIVTGSPTDFMRPLLAMLPVERVVGMDHRLDAQGRYTGQHAGISCAGVGKADKVRSLAGGAVVAFCAGNGDLDGPMMQLAGVPWSVYPNPEFAAWCAAQGWPILPRPADFVEEQKFGPDH